MVGRAHPLTRSYGEAEPQLGTRFATAELSARSEGWRRRFLGLCFGVLGLAILVHLAMPLITIAARLSATTVKVGTPSTLTVWPSARRFTLAIR